jgi:cholesterol transport system auxiliary component
MQKCLTSLCGALFVAAILGGCAIDRGQRATLFDLGPLSTAQAMPPSPQAAALPAISVAEVNVPPWLDTQRMYYRLVYANDLQPQPYADNRWSMPPAQLFGQRLKARFAQAGAVVLSASDGALKLPLLRIEMDEFSQHFSDTTHSTAQIALRASLFHGRTLVAQQTFLQQAVAPTNDASGGARGLAAASDATIGAMLVWLASLPPQK